MLSSGDKNKCAVGKEKVGDECSAFMLVARAVMKAVFMANSGIIRAAVSLFSG